MIRAILTIKVFLVKTMNGWLCPKNVLATDSKQEFSKGQETARDRGSAY
jgi:hypothetical protein